MKIEEMQMTLARLAQELVEAQAQAANARAAVAVAEDRVTQLTRAVDRIGGVIAGMTGQASPSEAAR